MSLMSFYIYSDSAVLGKLVFKMRPIFFRKSPAKKYSISRYLQGITLVHGSPLSEDPGRLGADRSGAGGAWPPLLSCARRHAVMRCLDGEEWYWASRTEESAAICFLLPAESSAARAAYDRCRWRPNVDEPARTVGGPTTECGQKRPQIFRLFSIIFSPFS